MKKIILLLLLSFAWQANAAQYSALYILGDSLSDTGNNKFPASDWRYWHGHYSNGQMWPEILSGYLGFAYSQANNKAFGGAATFDQAGYPGASTQLSQLPATIPSNAVCVVWLGTNDLQYVFYRYLLGLTGATNLYYQIAGQAMQNISNTVGALYARGARKIVVLNAYDVTLTTDYNEQNGSYWPHFVLFYFSLATTDFNNRLANTVASLRTRYHGLSLPLIDARGKLNAVTGLKTSRGWDDPLFLSTHDYRIGDAYRTWDGLHPTSKLDGMIALWIYGVL